MLSTVSTHLSPETRDLGSLAATVDRLIADSSGNLVSEQRSETRHAYPCLVKVTPVDKTGTTEQGPAVTVVGKHLSHGGWGFFHTSPLPYRYVTADFDSGCGCPTKILISLVWCRFLREGWYDSGGKLVRILASPYLHPKMRPQPK